MKPENNMVQEVRKLPELVRENVDDIDQKLRALLTPQEILDTKQIIIAGCGDSHMAGVAAEMAFRQIAGMRAVPMTALQAGRYTFLDSSQDLSRNLLTIGISVSGSVVRTCEALTNARQAGALTLAITANVDSLISRVSEKALIVKQLDSLLSPGVGSYRISLLALYLIAIRFAEVAGRISPDQADQKRQEIKSAASLLEQTTAQTIETARRLARDCKNNQNYVLTGYGPNLATALFGAAKIIEAAGLHAIGQDTEEWAHLQYFVSADPETPTFILSPGGRGHSRAAELVSPMTQIGRKIIAVVPEDDQLIAPQLNWVFRIPGNLPEWLTPLVYAVPVELFSSFLAEETHEAYFRLSNPVYENRDNTIRSSRLVHSKDL